MALSDFEKNFIYDVSSRLLTQDLLNNAYFAGSQVGRSLRDMVLARQPVQPLTNPFDEAITGTLRGDAAAVRRNADNVTEAAALVGTARSGTSQILEALAGMEDIIDKINTGKLDASDAQVQTDYNALRDQIIGVYESTDYNGIYMLDSSKWGTEQINSSGQVYIQAYKNGGFNISFHSVDDPVDGNNWNDLQGSELETDLAGQTLLVDRFSGAISTIDDLYKNRQTMLESQADSLESQAVLLDQAVEARRQNTTSLSVENLLINLILRESGSLLDEEG